MILLLIALSRPYAYAEAIVFNVDGRGTVSTENGMIRLAPGMVLAPGDIIHAAMDSTIEMIVPSTSLDPIRVMDGDRWKVPDTTLDERVNLPTLGRSGAGVSWRGDVSSDKPGPRHNGPLLPYWTRLAEPRLILSWASTPLAGEQIELVLTDLESGEVIENVRTKETDIMLPAQVSIRRGNRYGWRILSHGYETIQGHFEVVPQAELAELRSRLVDGNDLGISGHPNEWLIKAIMLTDAQLYLQAGRVLGEVYSTNGSAVARALLESVRGQLSGNYVRDSVEDRDGRASSQGAQDEN